MDVRTICLGILTRGDATGYEIKKLVEEGGYQHFVDASFGSIYPALNRLTEEGLVSLREEAQEKRPDRKVYSITPAGRAAFVAALMRPLPEDRHRSPFAFAMLFCQQIPAPRVQALLDEYVRRNRVLLEQINRQDVDHLMPGERFVLGLGQAIMGATVDFIETHRAEVEGSEKEAAE